MLERVGHVCPQYLVPKDKERLRKVVFVAIELVVNVMVSSVVVEQRMEDVTGKPQPAVVIHCLDGRKREKEYGCSWSHTGEEE